jgi:hypothetical protein
MTPNEQGGYEEHKMAREGKIHTNRIEKRN